MAQQRSSEDIRKQAAREATIGASGGGDGGIERQPPTAPVSPAAEEPKRVPEEAADMQPYSPGGEPRTSIEKKEGRPAQGAPVRKKQEPPN
ncbi:hypothetical protein [Chondromyces crocatus]|uniref:Uncharacterized protein n=1 Tax=Chondromyces crocatus TaxID=52 RepID=A0A0K1EHQ1_CHOCO|nr:hypothetical protein [Chondromyces crocatus]AKT40103.1 uncharacterized protein CMC5_042560 [Chondromyces crocatus]